MAVVSLPAPAFSQDAAFDAAGGYILLRDRELDANLHGWHVSVAGQLNPWFAVAGEVGGSRTTVDVAGNALDVSVYSMMAGPRLSARRAARLVPFVQALMGAARVPAIRVVGRRPEGGGFDAFSEMTTHFALEGGGGVDVMLTRIVGVRGSAAYRRIFEERRRNQLQAFVGLTLSTPRE